MASEREEKSMVVSLEKGKGSPREMTPSTKKQLPLEKFRFLGKDWAKHPEGGSPRKRGEGDQPDGCRRIRAHSFLFTFFNKPRNGREGYRMKREEVKQLAGELQNNLWETD